MKLGICCVYFYGPDSAWLLDLQLRYIRSTLQGYDYTIYAGANRLQPELRRTLEAFPNVKIVELPWFDGVDNSEHAFYLDRLLRHATSEGCTHLAALDADSFPVLPDWPRVLLERMGGARFAAVLRSENLDTQLPHPCGLFMERSFLLERDPRMLPPGQEIADFLRETGQRADTGIGYGYVLWLHKEPWLPLMRSNRKNLHFLMAGIYGDIFFHLGGASRSSPVFFADYRRSLQRRISTIRLVWRLGPWLLKRYNARNARILVTIANSLRKEPERFIASLR